MSVLAREREREDRFCLRIPFATKRLWGWDSDWDWDWGWQGKAKQGSGD